MLPPLMINRSGGGVTPLNFHNAVSRSCVPEPSPREMNTTGDAAMRANASCTFAAPVYSGGIRIGTDEDEAIGRELLIPPFGMAGEILLLGDRRVRNDKGYRPVLKHRQRSPAAGGMDTHATFGKGRQNRLEQTRIHYARGRRDLK